MRKLILFCVAIGTFDFIASQEENLDGFLGFVKPSLQGLQAPKIIGGSEAGRLTHPFQISIQVRVGAGVSHLCAGALIQLDRIVTAAHCVNMQNMNNLIVVAGDHDFQVIDGTEQRRAVQSMTIHPRFNPDTFDFDFAVIRPDQPFTTSNAVAVIALTAAEPTQGDCTVYGWGNTRTDGGMTDPSLLQQVNVPIVPRLECNTRFSGIAAITDRMICAGAPGRDSCNGDGGGPLVCGNQLAGIVSWGLTPCAMGNFPGVYANIAAERNFINA